MLNVILRTASVVVEPRVFGKDQSTLVRWVHIDIASQLDIGVFKIVKIPDNPSSQSRCKTTRKTATPICEWLLLFPRNVLNMIGNYVPDAANKGFIIQWKKDCLRMRNPTCAQDTYCVILICKSVQICLISEGKCQVLFGNKSVCLDYTYVR